MAEAHVPSSYRSYWVAWLVLLALTVAMIAVTRPAVIVAGIAVKTTIIGAWFMHLRYEKAGLVLSVALGILLTCFVLFLLISFDARVA